MVQRVWILLSVLVLWCVTACSVETLDIYQPPKGLDSIQQEDIKRAMWRLQQGVDASEWWQARAKQLHLTPIDSQDCFQHQGRSRTVIEIFTDTDPLRLAMMASMAKTVDHLDTAVTWQFCIGNDQGTFNLQEHFPEVTSFQQSNFGQVALDIRQVMVQLGIKE
jgi:hypothetical protein